MPGTTRGERLEPALAKLHQVGRVLRVFRVSSNRWLGGNDIGIETSYSPNQNQASYYYDPEE